MVAKQVNTVGKEIIEGRIFNNFIEIEIWLTFDTICPFKVSNIIASRILTVLQASSQSNFCNPNKKPHTH